MVGGFHHLPGAGIAFLRSYGWDGLVKAFFSLSKPIPDYLDVEPVAIPRLGDDITWLRDEMESSANEVALLGQLAKKLKESDLVSTPFGTNFSKAISDSLKSTMLGQPRTLIFVGSAGIGGSVKFALNLADALEAAEGIGSVRVIATDKQSSLTTVSNQSRRNLIYEFPVKSSALSSSERLHISYLQASFQSVKRIISVNSETGYELFKLRGKVLRRSGKKLYPAFFCADYLGKNKDISFGRRYFEILDGEVDGFLSDHSAYLKELAHFSEGDYTNKSTRLIPLLQPVEISGRKINFIRESHTPKVLWASRISPQKGYMTVRKVARLCPEVEFHVFGQGSRLDVTRLIARKPKNLIYRGEFTDFYELQPEEFDLFLYTGLWDGIPNTLLEAASAGLPIVTSNVGGITELVGDPKSRALVIANPVNAREYATAIRRTIECPGLAQDILMRMTEYLRDSHSIDRFYHRVKADLVANI